MATVIVGMTTSLDGFVTDPSGSADPLYPDLADLRGTPHMNAMIERTGAVLSGLRFLDNIDPARARLEKIDVEEVGARTSLRFRVVRT